MTSPNPPRGSSVAFLLTQVGTAAAERFGGRLEAIAISRPEAGLLRALAANEPMSQQALAAHLDLAPSRLVVLVDDLEHRGIVERRADPSDRRLYAIHLTTAGRAILERLGRIAREHDQDFCSALTSEERTQLGALLEKLASAHGLRAGVHPGFRHLAVKPKRTSAKKPR
jgi:DNA-binding MarR family transcriptional regulator